MSTSVERALVRVTAALPGGGEVRDGQISMANAVSNAIESRRHLVVQAGTGTGKSLGYLVPALVSGKRVVVATATKALQDQLAGKDLPFLQQHLGTPFEFALLKGRSNYFCWQRATEAADPKQATLDGIAPVHQEEIRGLITWAGTTVSGDRADLAREPSEHAWSAVSISSVECPGANRCPSGEICFTEQARRKAAEADVIVVNMHLYGQHVASGGFVLPEHDVVVLDEAHEAEDIFADCLTIEVGGGRFATLAGRIRAVVSDIDSEVDVAGTGSLIEDALAPLTGTLLRAGPSSDAQLRAALTVAIDRVQRAIGVLRKVPEEAGGGVGPKKMRAVQSATALLIELTEAAELGRIASQRPEGKDGRDGTDGKDGPGDEDRAERSATERVAWVQAGGGMRGPQLCIAPIEVAPLLERRLWPNVTAVLTSATIPANLVDRIGLSSDTTDVLDVGSPFDFSQQALLYCAVHLPDPRSANYEAAMHDELAALIAAAGGRTLALFTSWRAMRAAVAALSERHLPGRLLQQGELPKPKLTAAFADDETSSLFATMGFWQGIDVPGRSLSLVVIDKLPFARPDEPLLIARREKAGAAAFERIDLPRAATLLAQGAGRLIRTRVDRGVVAVLDPRLNAARYRWELIRSLPPMRRTRHRADAEDFLRQSLESTTPEASTTPTAEQISP